MTGKSKTTLIVLRGNSGSGKTTLARALQQRRGRDQLAVISQDVVRREVLWANDRAGNPAIGLIDLMPGTPWSRASPSSLKASCIPSDTARC